MGSKQLLHSPSWGFHRGSCTQNSKPAFLTGILLELPSLSVLASFLQVSAPGQDAAMLVGFQKLWLIYFNVVFFSTPSSKENKKT